MAIKSEVDVPEEVAVATVGGRTRLESREVFISLYGVDRRLERSERFLNQIPTTKRLFFSQVFYCSHIIFSAATRPLQLFHCR